MPSDFRFLDANPASLAPPQLNRGKAFLGQFGYGRIARLKPGVTIEQARSDMTRMSGRRLVRELLTESGVPKQLA